MREAKNKRSNSSIKNKKMYNLPIDYTKLNFKERKKIRNQYI